jgi:hypothetical protein
MVSDEQNLIRIKLLLASFLALFTELALIRFIPGHIPFVSYFTNIILIASFFGLGLGFLFANSLVRWNLIFLPALLMMGLFVEWFNAYGTVSQVANSSEPFWSDSFPNKDKIELHLFVVVFLTFIMASVICIPVGQLMGQCFTKLERLASYNLDLLGSLIGVLFFALLSYLNTPPFVWLIIITFLAILLFQHSTAQKYIGVFLGAVLVLASLLPFENNEQWSSYYRVNWYQPLPSTTVITANNVIHQAMFDFDSDIKEIKISAERYSTPYKVFSQISPQYDKSNKENCVLIVGAGSGNDVAIAQKMGFTCIHAVEIDKSFSALGMKLHAQKPYSEQGVTLFIDDARAYFKKAYKREQQYVAVIFATLDSMSLTGGLSTRLDSYVYTEESFKNAYDLLKPGGIIGVYHMSQRDYISGRITKLLYAVNNQLPLVWNFQDHLTFNWTFVQAKDVELSKSGILSSNFDKDYLAFIEGLEVPTDDWPFLFLESKVIPMHYIQVLLGVLLLSVMVIGFTIRKKAKYFDMPLFLLGAGFLLLETKSVTQMAMLFGSTWIVNILVFSSILAVLIISNYTVSKFGRKLTTARIKLLFIILAVILLILSFIPITWIYDKSDIIQWIYASVIVALPIGLAGLIFPALFKRAKNTEVAFASNLLGAVMGGVLEYFVMIVGVSAMSLIAAILYLSAFLFWTKGERI